MIIEFSTNCEHEARLRLAKGSYSPEGIEKIIGWVKNGWVRVLDPMMYGEPKLAFHNTAPFRAMFPEAKDDYQACRMAINSCFAIAEIEGRA